MIADNPATRLAWKIRDIQHRQMVHVFGILGRYGLHAGQPRILHTIIAMDGAAQRQIAEQLQVSSASLAMSLKRMQKNGLLRKDSDERDLRVNTIRLTNKGLEVAEASRAEVITADERMFRGFSPAEMEQLSVMLDRIYQNVDYDDGTPPCPGGPGWPRGRGMPPAPPFPPFVPHPDEGEDPAHAR